jgi:hypothetical protein
VTIFGSDPTQKVRKAKRFLGLGLYDQTALRDGNVHREVLGKTNLRRKRFGNP